MGSLVNRASHAPLPFAHLPGRLAGRVWFTHGVS
jgi:hypothetical protein